MRNLESLVIKEIKVIKAEKAKKKPPPKPRHQQQQHLLYQARFYLRVVENILSEKLR